MGLLPYERGQESLTRKNFVDTFLIMVFHCAVSVSRGSCGIIWGMTMNDKKVRVL
jgi:hypothetical protein